MRSRAVGLQRRARPRPPAFWPRRPAFLSARPRVMTPSTAVERTDQCQRPRSPAAQTFMVFATIRDDTNFAEFAALRDDEQKQLEVLRSDGGLAPTTFPPPGGQRSSRSSPPMRNKSRRRWQLCLSPGSSTPMSTRSPPRTQRRLPTERGHEPEATLTAAMTSLLDSGSVTSGPTAEHPAGRGRDVLHTRQLPRPLGRHTGPTG